LPRASGLQTTGSAAAAATAAAAAAAAAATTASGTAGKQKAPGGKQVAGHVAMAPQQRPALVVCTLACLCRVRTTKDLTKWGVFCGIFVVVFIVF
jgi:hypothetical protein